MQKSDQCEWAFNVGYKIINRNNYVVIIWNLKYIEHFFINRIWQQILFSVFESVFLFLDILNLLYMNIVSTAIEMTRKIVPGQKKGTRGEKDTTQARKSTRCPASTTDVGPIRIRTKGCFYSDRRSLLPFYDFKDSGVNGIFCKAR